MKTLRIGEYDFSYGGEALEVRHGDERLCELPLAHVLLFALKWEAGQGQPGEEQFRLPHERGLMGTKVIEHLAGEPLGWE